MKLALLFATASAITAAAAQYKAVTTNGMNLARSASHDGRAVAVTTWSSLKTEDTNELADIYIFDRVASSVALASAGTNGFTRYGSAGYSVISSNGNSVLFDFGSIYLHRVAEDMTETITATGTPAAFALSRDGRYTFYTLNATQALYRRDNNAGTNQTVASLGGSVSISEDGERAAFAQNASRTVVLDFLNATTNTVAPAPALSGNGQVVASRSAGLNLIVQDLSTGASNAVANLVTSASLSADGGIIAYEMRGNLGTPPFGSVAYLDRVSGTTQLLSITAGTAVQAANGWSGAPVVSRDGRYIAFESWATDLVADDTNNTKDVFLYDVRGKIMTRVNTGDGPSFNPFFSDDSTTLFFHNGETDGDVDIFAMTLENFLIRGITIEAGGTRRLTWSSLPEVRYQLECKTSLESPDWIPVGGEVPSGGSETSATDTQSDTSRFYRVRRLE